MHAVFEKKIKQVPALIAAGYHLFGFHENNSYIYSVSHNVYVDKNSIFYFELRFLILADFSLP